MRRRRSYSEPVGVRSKVGHFNRPKWDINSDAYSFRCDDSARTGVMPFHRPQLAFFTIAVWELL